MIEAINSKLKQQFNNKLAINCTIHKFEFSWLRCQINGRETLKVSAVYIMERYNAYVATRDSSNLACARQGCRGCKSSLSIHHTFQSSSDIQLQWARSCAYIAFADLRKQRSAGHELEITRIREDNANVTGGNNKDSLCLSIGRQSAESINGNLFACYVFP